jgi:hypothetical protein
MLGCFFAVVVPEYQMIKDCPAMNPLSMVFDHVGQIDISGLAKNLSLAELVLKFYGCGVINPGCITGICITRGNGSVAPHSNSVQHQDVLHLMGKNVMRVSINPAARVFDSISHGSRTLKCNLRPGRDFKESKRQEHGAALTAWKAARIGNVSALTVALPRSVEMVPAALPLQGGSAHDMQMMVLMQQYSNEIASLRNEIRAAAVASAASIAAAAAASMASFAEAAATAETAAEADTLRRGEILKAKQARRERLASEEAGRAAKEDAEKEEALRLHNEREAEEERRRKRERAEDAAGKENAILLAESRHKEIMDKTVVEMEISKKSNSQAETLIAYLMRREETLASKEDQAAANAKQVAMQSEALASLATELSLMREAREKAQVIHMATTEEGRVSSRARQAGGN